MMIALSISTLLLPFLFSPSIAATVNPELQTTSKCASIKPPVVIGAEVTSFTTLERRNYSGLVVDESVPAIKLITDVNVCEVNVSLTHQGVGDEVQFQVWLPLKGWNERFQAVGGGGWVAGNFGTPGLGLAVQQGFAAGITRGGNISDDQGFMYPEMVTKTGEVNLGRLHDFGSRSLHELAIVGKAATTSYYGKKPKYSYWNGCSTGGRQGFTLAQKYPEDFQGILANAPAIRLAGLIPSLGWAELTTRRLGHYPSKCVLNAFTSASTLACDAIDGVIDGVISDPEKCQFDATSLVGKSIDCNGTQTIITQKDVNVIETIHKGPVSALGKPLFESFPWGISYLLQLPKEDNPTFAELWNRWISLLVKRDRNHDIDTFNSVLDFEETFALSNLYYSGMIGTDNPDLSGLRDAGGKLLSWHGTTDEIIPMKNSVSYRKIVEDVMGGNKAVNEYFRLFLVPGAKHCYGGSGAYPADAMQALMNWVEKGQAPDMLHGTQKVFNGTVAERIMCPWPKLPRYNGSGNANSAKNYSCK